MEKQILKPGSASINDVEIYGTAKAIQTTEKLSQIYGTGDPNQTDKKERKLARKRLFHVRKYLEGGRFDPSGLYLHSVDMEREYNIKPNIQKFKLYEDLGCRACCLLEKTEVRLAKEKNGRRKTILRKRLKRLEIVLEFFNDQAGQFCPSDHSEGGRNFG